MTTAVVRATIYGIPNCDTVKKTRTWLTDHGIDHTFHNYKLLGIAPDRLKAWADVVGWEVLLNRAGTTFRKLAQDDRQDIDRSRVIALMVAHPSLIKRPVVEHGGGLLVGFKPDLYQQAFA